MNKFQIINFSADFIVIFKNLIIYAIIARIIVSWFTMGRYGQRPSRIVRFLNDITNPFINLARKLPHRIAMIDFAPLIAIIGLDLLAQLIVMLLAKLV